MLGFPAEKTPSMDFSTARPSSRPPRLAITASFTLIAVFVIWLILPRRSDPQDEVLPLPVISKAVAVLNGETVSGTVTFTQLFPTAPVTVSGEVKNLKTSTKHGFHVHASGDLSNGCASAGSHFNPFERTHGAPTDIDRHVGDLGNIETDSKGVASFTFEDSLLSLNGPLSIVGRSVVVHAGTDDLGRGGDDESLKTGNAGGRAACGVIGLAA
ncbi:superoxide dismutase [Dichomitus squalens]|uniref:Superoxide dismutase [Cu-Zn] n=1 Tax=Dichomitus squalens TaxID=114155 RepID=A0A4Q9PQD3_9APHY|nr:superoxide dismutase [Dichomitus squalens]TBU56570.1 superoxide dismutase [Dichomitus squalens]